MNKITITTSSHCITNPETLRIHGLYTARVTVARTSGKHDIFAIISSQEIAAKIVSLKSSTSCIQLTGELRSRNENGHLYVYAWITDIADANHTDQASTANAVELTGTICTAPTLRTTPGGYTISDTIIVAMNGAQTRSYYLPVITWGSVAHKLASCEIGTDIKITGRFQSRTYSKNEIAHTAYEVSVNTLDILNNAVLC